MRRLSALLLLIVCAMTTAADTAPIRPLIVAHRGESRDAPENTLAAFRLAWERNVPAVELDAQLSRDGQVVLCHDADTARTTGKQQALVIKDTPAAELRRLDVGSWKNARYAGERLPLLAEMLVEMPAGRQVFIELKSEDEALVPAVMAVVKASGVPPASVTIIAFRATFIAAWKRQWPDGPRALLLASFKRKDPHDPWTPGVEALIAAAKACGADGLDVQNKPVVDQSFVARVHAAGLSCMIWTENDLKTVPAWTTAGIDGITTDRAAEMMAALAAGR